MNVSSYNTRDLQNFRSLLAVAIEENRDLHALAATVNTELDSRLQMMEVVTPTPASSKPAVIMPLTGSDWTADATHAVQCQNRPAMDKPWLLQHCGHTEYIVLGDR
ncbi:MAG: hypothetical protein UT69_C0038G0003 [Candidatus Yanofskybacteria bacterium GW2011_GWE1_40_10]|nr:MAG: hypothetical protein UT69_C0038G0003 [Candidatus Yanofskybacteria bacterium GW2011_GWE1_40_10]